MDDKLPTEEAEEAMMDAAQKHQQRQDAVPQMERIERPDEGGGFQAEPPIETLNELYGKAFWGDGQGAFPEINKHAPTGYLTEREIEWLHGLHDVVRQLHRIQDLYNIPLGPTADHFLRKMDYTTMVSKSRNGFAIKEVSQTRVESDEVVQTDHGDTDEPGVFDRLKRAVGGSGLGDAAVIGKPEYGTYVGGARGRTAQQGQQNRGRRRRIW